MKEKKFKLMKYLLFGVFTCLIGFGAAGCGDDYDDTGIKSEMKGLKEALAKLEGSSVNKDGLSEAVKTAVAASKNEVMAAVAGMISSGGQNYTVAQTTDVLGQLMALNSFFSTSTLFAQAVTTLDGVVNELGTKAGTAPGLLEGMKQMATDVAMLKNQMAILKSGTGDVNQFQVIKSIQDRLTAIETGTGGGTPNYDAIAAALAVNKEFMAKIIEQIGGDLNMLPVSSMITRIELVNTSYGTTFTPALSYTSATTVNADEYVFGAGLTNEIKFPKSGKFKAGFTIDSVIVRVTPANAELKPEMISLVNSKGENVNSHVRVTGVQPYNYLLTRGATTGLYKVTFGFTNSYDAVQFGKAISVAVNATTSKGVLFALAVDSKIAGASDSRQVLTDFAVGFNSGGNAPNSMHTIAASDFINFAIDGTPVANIRNRYHVDREKVWNGTGFAKITDNLAAAPASSDDRIIQPSHPIKVGRPFEVKMDATMASAFAYYIALDMPNVGTDGPAWDAAKPTITGMNKVYMIGETAKLTVNDQNMKGKELGFRVYLVNQDGTYVDPDGRSFYVICDQEMNAAKLIFKVENSTWPYANTVNLSTDFQKVPYWTATTNDKIKFFDFTVTESGVTFTVSGTYDGTSIMGTTPTYTSPIQLADIRQPKDNAPGEIKIIGLKARNLKDGVPTTGKLTLRGSNNEVLMTYDMEVTKVMPTKLPANMVLQDIHTDANVTVGDNSYAIGAGNKKLITIIPQAEFEKDINSAMFGKLIKATYNRASTDAEINALFGSTTITGMTMTMPNAAQVKQEGGQVTLTNGYNSETELPLSFTYNYGEYKYNGEEYKQTVSSDYKVKFASVLAGYDLTFDIISGFSFTLGQTLNMTVSLKYAPFAGTSAGQFKPFTKTEMDNFIDTAASTFTGAITYYEGGVEKSITLIHNGYDTASGNPKISMSSADAAKLAVFNTAPGTACGIHMTVTDRLGAKCLVSGNVNIYVNSTSGQISISPL